MNLEVAKVHHPVGLKSITFTLTSLTQVLISIAGLSLVMIPLSQLRTFGRPVLLKLLFHQDLQ